MVEDNCWLENHVPFGGIGCPSGHNAFHPAFNEQSIEDIYYNYFKKTDFSTKIRFLNLFWNSINITFCKYNEMIRYYKEMLAICLTLKNIFMEKMYTGSSSQKKTGEKKTRLTQSKECLSTQKQFLGFQLNEETKQNGVWNASKKFCQNFISASHWWEKIETKNFENSILQIFPWTTSILFNNLCR